MGVSPIGIEGDSPFTFGDGLFMLPFQTVDVAPSGMSEGKGIIKGEGLWINKK
jgi:hypothetical protein